MFVILLKSNLKALTVFFPDPRLKIKHVSGKKYVRMYVCTTSMSGQADIFTRKR